MGEPLIGTCSSDDFVHEAWTTIQDCTFGGPHPSNVKLSRLFALLSVEDEHSQKLRGTQEGYIDGFQAGIDHNGGANTATSVQRKAGAMDVPFVPIEDAAEERDRGEGIARVEWIPKASINELAATPSASTDQPSPSSLPSETASQRWPTSRRLSRLMDTLLARASIASQRINTYTGTDYTGIEALRQKIIDQESAVKERHAAVDTARAGHREAHAKQSGAQKEIVSLLERKSNWSPGDLERYMGLVRSEHSLEADVGTAKDGLQAAERELEEARSLLERLERKQYHEEQVWSDTIRRNSTWVTFGLMGLNIVLLLAQIAIFEPYRRRKIVREVKVALDEKAAMAASAPVPAREVEKQVEEVIEPAGASAEAMEKAVARDEAPVSEKEQVPATKEVAGKPALVAGEVLPEEALRVEQNVPKQPTSRHPDTWTGSWEAALEGLQDLFSERMIQIKKVDLTAIALQGAATGFAAMGLLFLMFRPR